ncbi:hypothetical protein ABIB00_007865, partial [Bradyrhizobium sp. LB14.3]
PWRPANQFGGAAAFIGEKLSSNILGEAMRGSKLQAD